MKRITLLLLFVLATSVSQIFADTQSDSIRKEMPNLQGEELLQAYSNLCRLAAAANDSVYEMNCLKDYLAESLKQHDVEAEGLARASILNYYYNYSMFDNITGELPEYLAAMEKNQTWDYYFNSWNVLIEMYLYQEKLQTALKEAEKMYAYSRDTKNNYGIGVSSYCIGGIYQTMGRFPEAQKALEEGVEALSKEEDITLLLACYNTLGQTLDGLGKYEELRIVANKWKTVLDKYKEKALARGYTPALGGRYLYCTLAAAIAEIETKHYDEAAQLLDLAEQLAQGRKQIARLRLLEIQARYYAATQHYDKAIECNRENMDILTAVEDSVSMLTVELRQAELFRLSGRYKESSELYKEIIPRRDRLRNTELSRQLDELRTIFEVDKLTLQSQIANTRFYFATVISLLLLFIIVIYIIYTRRLTRKNHILYDTILQSRKLEQEAQISLDKSDENTLEEDEQLYRRLCRLMQDEQLYTDQSLNREILANRLNTNRTYLANAVKKFSNDATIIDFINDYRLKYAAMMLTEDPVKSIKEVEFLSGFNSRTTFIRIFREQFGMSPSEYKVIAKEKRVKS